MNGPTAMERKLQSGIMAGKLNGAMAAVTPSGILLVSVSMSLDTSSFCPITSDGNPQADSTTCNPRRTSPFASARVLPCSRTIDLAMSSWYLRSRSCKLSRRGCQRRGRDLGGEGGPT